MARDRHGRERVPVPDRPATRCAEVPTGSRNGARDAALPRASGHDRRAGTHIDVKGPPPLAHGHTPSGCADVPGPLAATGVAADRSRRALPGAVPRARHRVRALAARRGRAGAARRRRGRGGADPGRDRARDGDRLLARRCPLAPALEPGVARLDRRCRCRRGPVVAGRDGPGVRLRARGTRTRRGGRRRRAPRARADRPAARRGRSTVRARPGRVRPSTRGGRVGPHGDRRARRRVGSGDGQARRGRRRRGEGSDRRRYRARRRLALRPSALGGARRGAGPRPGGRARRAVRAVAFVRACRRTGARARRRRHVRAPLRARNPRDVVARRGRTLARRRHRLGRVGRRPRPRRAGRRARVRGAALQRRRHRPDVRAHVRGRLRRVVRERGRRRELRRAARRAASHARHGRDPAGLARRGRRVHLRGGARASRAWPRRCGPRVRSLARGTARLRARRARARCRGFARAQQRLLASARLARRGPQLADARARPGARRRPVGSRAHVGRAASGRARRVRHRRRALARQPAGPAARTGLRGTHGPSGRGAHPVVRHPRRVLAPLRRRSDGVRRQPLLRGVPLRRCRIELDARADPVQGRAARARVRRDPDRRGPAVRAHARRGARVRGPGVELRDPRTTRRGRARPHVRPRRPDSRRDGARTSQHRRRNALGRGADRGRHAGGPVRIVRIERRLPVRATRRRVAAREFRRSAGRLGVRAHRSPRHLDLPSRRGVPGHRADDGLSRPVDAGDRGACAARSRPGSRRVRPVRAVARRGGRGDGAGDVRPRARGRSGARDARTLVAAAQPLVPERAASARSLGLGVAALRRRARACARGAVGEDPTRVPRGRRARRGRAGRRGHRLRAGARSSVLWDSGPLASDVHELSIDVVAGVARIDALEYLRT